MEPSQRAYPQTAASTQASAPARQAVFLEQVEQRSRRLVAIGATATPVGVILLLGHVLAGTGVVLGWVAALAGPCAIWAGLAWLRRLPGARKALTFAPLDARLDINVYPGGYAPFTTAQLWPRDSDERMLARFSSMHWEKPRLTPVSRAQALVYGEPRRGATVVASSPEVIIVGRIRQSRFGQRDTNRTRAGALSVAIVAGLFALASAVLVVIVLAAAALAHVKHPVGGLFGAVIVAAFGGIMFALARKNWREWQDRSAASTGPTRS